MPDRRFTKNVRGVLTPISLVLALAALAGSAAGCAARQDARGGTAVVALLTEPASLNPVTDQGTAGTVPALLFNGLTTLDEQLVPVPDLAESWEISADGLAWTFHLRRGVKFHDGVGLTSRDVIYSLRVLMDPAISPNLSQVFSVISGVEAVDEYTVKVTLHAPYAGLTNLMVAEILPAHLLEDGQVSMEAFGRAPVGTGPFKLQVWNDGEIVLAAHTEYFVGRPSLDGIVVRSFPDSASAWAALMRSEVHYAPDLRREDYAVLRDDPRFRVATYLDVFYYTVLFNLQDPLVADSRVREALDLALDRKDIIADTLSGVAQETTGPFRPGTWPYDPTLASVPHDTTRARELLSQSGWADHDADGILDRDGADLEIALLVDQADTLKVAVAQRIKWQLLALGIKVNVEFLEGQTMIQERLLPGRFQCALFPFNAATDPDVFLSLFWHSKQIGGFNLARYNSPTVDALIERGRAEPDQAKRQEIYRSIHREMAKDRPALFLFVPQRLVGMSSRLEGVSTNTELVFLSAKDWTIQADPSDRR